MKKILFKKITNNPFGFCKATATATATAEDSGRQQQQQQENLKRNGKRGIRIGEARKRQGESKRNERILFMVLMSQACSTQ